MSAIWMESEGSWSLQTPAAYVNEQLLHDLVVDAPLLLPLSGRPALSIVGREVALRSGYADVIAVESDGRPVVIEVKLRNNAESRRAVVAQTLSYAASLHGLTRQEFEEVVLARHLEGNSLFDQSRDALQDESLSQSAFNASLETHLAEGSFRLVIVLDEAPQELISLVGLLEAVTAGISLDLIVINSYDIDGRRVAVPQRLDPERREEIHPSAARTTRSSFQGHTEPGVAPFRQIIDETASEYRPAVTGIADMVDGLIAAETPINIETHFGKEDASLRLRFPSENAGLVVFWRYANGKPSVSFWRTVFERHAPRTSNSLKPRSENSWVRATRRTTSHQSC